MTLEDLSPPFRFSLVFISSSFYMHEHTQTGEEVEMRGTYWEKEVSGEPSRMSLACKRTLVCLASRGGHTLARSA